LCRYVERFPGSEILLDTRLTTATARLAAGFECVSLFVVGGGLCTAALVYSCPCVQLLNAVETLSCLKAPGFQPLEPGFNSWLQSANATSLLVLATSRTTTGASP
jgi:hypothetical protein